MTKELKVEIRSWVKLGLLGKVILQNKLLGSKWGFCGKSVCLKDLEENWAFREKIGLLVKMSVRKRYFG